MGAGFFLAQISLRYLFFDPAMVLGYLMQDSGPQELGSAVPDVGNIKLVTPNYGNGACGPHSSFI